MKKLLLPLLTLCLVLTACRKDNANAQQANTFYNNSKATQEITRSKVVEYEQPAPLKDRPEQILRRTGYTTSYNKETRNPNWVAWHLTKGHTYGKNQRSDEVFSEDTEVSPRATDNDYYNSRYDRGHMCPAGDNKWDATAMTESFLFTNICPQVHALNEGAWNDLELACRRWARKYGDVYIVCGPILDDSQHRTIGRRKVVVPKRFFKVILCLQDGPKAIGFIYENSSHNSRSLFKNATNVDEIEQLTGIDFFPKLRDDIETRIEATRGYF